MGCCSRTHHGSSFRVARGLFINKRIVCVLVAFVCTTFFFYSSVKRDLDLSLRRRALFVCNGQNSSSFECQSGPLFFDGNRSSETSRSSSMRTFRWTPVRTTTLPPELLGRRPRDVSRYVSFGGGFEDGRGIGNQIFCFAAAVYIAELTGRQVAIKRFSHVLQLDEVFDLKVDRYGDLCPCYYVHESRHLAFQQDVDKDVVNRPSTANSSIFVNGFRQSWRYTLAIESRLRQHLVFRKVLTMMAEAFLRDNAPPGWNRAGFVRVGIHVRRGDITVHEHLIKYGYTVPSERYFETAMNYFTNRYSQVQFIAISEDTKWTKEHVTVKGNVSNDVANVTYAFGHSSGFDLALLSLCDHVIMSTGSFGWWGAWLAKGTTIYYGDWPRKGSGLEKQFERKDFFPPNWIPIFDSQ